MNKISIDKETLLYFYRKYRDYIIPVVTIIVSFLLLVQITIPTLDNLTEKGEQLKLEKNKLTTLQNNLRIINEIDAKSLDSELSISNSALPIEKNFAEILNAVSISANKSSVFLGDYEFQVGDLGKILSPAKGFPSLSLSLVINGNANAAARFIVELYRSFPISEITNIDVTGNRASFSIVFYYKPLSLTKNDENASLLKLSSEDLSLMRDLSTWNDPKILEQLPAISLPTPASSSAKSI